MKEFVFAQTCVSVNLESMHVEVEQRMDGGGVKKDGKRESTRQDIIEEIVGEAGIMSFLKHPNILHLYGCTLTAQAIWIVSELCEVGSLRMLLDDTDIPLSNADRIQVSLSLSQYTSLPLFPSLSLFF